MTRKEAAGCTGHFMVVDGDDYVSFGSLSDECEAVARAIERFRVDGESVAVLARTNAALIQMQSWLIKRQVPFRRDGPSVWEHRAVVAYMALLQALTRATTPDLMTFLQQGPLDVPLVTDTRFSDPFPN